MGKHAITATIFDKRGKTLSIGQNSYVRTHPLQARCANAVGEPHKVFLHAEIAALIRLRDWSKAYKMVITRYTKDGQPAMAMPCRACQHALKLAGIKYVEHT